MAHLNRKPASLSSRTRPTTSRNAPPTSLIQPTARLLRVFTSSPEGDSEVFFWLIIYRGFKAYLSRCHLVLAQTGWAQNPITRFAGSRRARYFTHFHKTKTLIASRFPLGMLCYFLKYLFME